ncbi:MAG: pantoate--beta-alanine ligase [Fimbriiglobus sp.]
MPDLSPVVTTVADLRTAVAAARGRGLTVGLVPTMGALHAGHAALIRAARRDTGFVVVTVFVNPTQFGPTEDYAKYPRTLDGDRAVCAEAGADLVFAPPPAEVYQNFSVTFVEVTKLDETLCGPRRPGHFRGVCTVVLKLFHMAQPDVAVFGAKDAQQVRIIRQMVRDLNVPVDVQIVPTVRDPDGLAMSSRNRYLTPAERAVAPNIYAALQALAVRASQGERDVARLEARLFDDLAAIPGSRVDYASVVDDTTLQPLTTVDRPALVAAAVFLGPTRLIDNITIR